MSQDKQKFVMVIQRHNLPAVRVGVRAPSADVAAEAVEMLCVFYEQRGVVATPAELLGPLNVPVPGEITLEDAIIAAVTGEDQ